jgi:hypothetical protein
MFCGAIHIQWRVIMLRSIRLISVNAVVCGLFVAASAFAGGPALETKCGKINIPGNVNAVAYPSEDCQQLFVLPPSTGKAAVTAVSPRQNLDFCPAVKKVGETATSTINSAAIVADRIEQMIEDYDPLSDEIDELAEDLREASRQRDIAKDEFERLEAVKADHLEAVGTAKGDLDVCVALGNTCTAEQAAYNAAVAELRTFLTTEYVPGQRAYSVAKANFTSAFSAYSSATSDYAEALTPLFGLMDKLISLNTTVTGLYNQYVRLSGFTAALTYSTGWANAIARFQSANSGKTVSKMPIKRPKLAASAVGLQGFETDTPAIISLAIPGVVSGQAYDMMALPSGGEKITSLTAPFDPSVQYDNAFGDSVGANVNVSLMGACPFYPNGLNGGIVGDINDLTAEVSMNAFYEYDLQVRRGYTASYNMSQWLSRVEKVVKKGGFFSSKTLHEVVEDSNSSDWFSITFNASSSGFTYTPAEQDRIKLEVKAQLQERALMLLAIQMNLMPSSGSPSVPPLQPTGAGTAATYLMKGCGYWSWCLGGSFVLGVLDSIFGRSTAVSDFKKHNSVWVTETVNGIAFLEQKGVMTYVK